ncbi:MAG: PRC-barrel domain-containing protein [Candidatus Berkelbacteria bacterium]|nr:PRC-barrel domain-containing protein [Candidatus Berkelbacteria bacterium]
MIIRYLQIKGMPVFSQNSQENIGQIDEIVFFKSEPKIAAFVLRKPLVEYFGSKNIIHPTDIILIAKDAILVADEKAKIPLPEATRVQKLIDEHIFGLKQRVVTKSGQRLGIVEDIYFQSDTLEISKLIVKSIFDEKIIPASEIIEIKKHKIVINNPEVMQKIPKLLNEKAAIVD